MSGYRQSQASKKPAPKPYCKVCHDSGKPEDMYRSHWVKDKPGVDGVVVCPTLLSKECRFCNKMGHMIAFCATRVQYEKDRSFREKARAKSVRKVTFEVKKDTAAANKPGRFAALDDAEDSEFPALTSARDQVLTPTFLAKGSYLHMVSLQPLFQEEKVQVREIKSVKSRQMPVPKAYIPRSQRSWANDSDWESGDEVDYDVLEENCAW